MRIVPTTDVTVDGVMQGLGGAKENPRNGFKCGGGPFRSSTQKG